MRNKKRPQTSGKQLALFPAEIVSLRPLPDKDSGTMPNREGESNFLSLLSGNRVLTETLLDKIMSPKNLNKAYENVVRNDGASGVDDMPVSELRCCLSEHGKSLITDVLSERYTPSEVLGIEISKSSGGVRLLGIPTVIDRLVQQAIHQELNLLYEPLFSEHSYGFSPWSQRLTSG